MSPGRLHPPGRRADTRSMIYLVYEKQELIAETDTLDFVKQVVRVHPDCAIKEMGTGKVYKPKLVRKSA